MSMPHPLSGPLASRLGWPDLAALLVRAAPAVTVVALWMLMHPYEGIDHDARLYVVQALHALTPDTFARDLFFAFGSQDDYTLFTPIFAPLVDHLGPSAAAMLVLIVGHVLWLGGAAALALRLADDRRAAVIALVFVAVLPPLYAGYSSLAYGERFLTPRIFAEAATLWALWCVSRRRPVAAIAVLLAASALHPLMGAVGLGVLVAYLMIGDRRWAIAVLAVAVAGGGLAAAGIAPFDRLIRPMDAEWLAIVMPRNVICFPTLWTARDWAIVALDATVVLSAALVHAGWQRRTMLAVLLAGLGGIGVTIIGADVLHSVFFIQVQLYRSAWILHLFAHLAGGLLLVRLWRGRANAPAITAAMTAGWVLASFLAPLAGAVLGMAASLSAAAQLRWQPRALRRPVAAAIVVVAGLAVAFVAYIRTSVTIARIDTHVADGTAQLAAYLKPSLIEVVLVGVVVLLFTRIAPRAARRAFAPVALAALVLAVAAWDRRDDWTRGLEGAFPAEDLRAAIPDGATVYWDRDIRGAWLLLGRASGPAVDHGAGLLFSRETALAYRDQAGPMQAITGREMFDFFRHRDAVHAAPPAIDRATLVQVCRDVDTLDFMVLARAVDGAYALQWHAPSPMYDERALARGAMVAPARDFYLYDCARLRAS